MSEDKQSDNDPERTLLTLDQLSQTIEVMTNVVNRLRQHLSEQLRAQAEASKIAKELAEQVEENSEATQEAASAEKSAQSAKEKLEQQAAKTGDKGSFVVEIKQHDADPDQKNSKTLH